MTKTETGTVKQIVIIIDILNVMVEQTRNLKRLFEIKTKTFVERKLIAEANTISVNRPILYTPTLIIQLRGH